MVASLFCATLSLVVLIRLYFLLSTSSCSHTITMVMFNAQQNIHLKVCCMTGLNSFYTTLWVVSLFLEHVQC